MYRAILRAFLLCVCGLLPLAAAADPIVTGLSGGDQPHTNMQPTLGMNYIIALQGLFPSRNKGDEPIIDDPLSDTKSLEPYVGEVSIFAGNFAPRGWAECDGQILPISQYQALFSLLGTTYGGDGRTTFALPDLRGRTPIQPGTGPGLSTWTLGQRQGANDVALTEAQIPSHDHTLPPSSEMTDPTGGGQSHPNIQPSLGLNYTISLQGIYPSRTKGPDEFIAEVSMFASNFAPRNEAFPQGQLLSIAQNTALFSLVGTTYGGDGRTTFGLPNLQGRAVMGAGNGPGLTPRQLGALTGVENVTLTENQLPSHDHTLPSPFDPTSGDTGGGQTHENMQPSIALNYIIALQGVYPSRNKGDELLLGDDLLLGEEIDPLSGTKGGLDPFIGEVSLFAGNFAPRGWAFCEGQLLPISQYDALFSLVGTMYGGDGRTTFGLPDLRGRVPVHYGNGPGLDPVYIGQKFGVESVALGLPQMPSHAHAFTVPEPATIVQGVVLALAALAFAAWRRRDR